jgi:hypothetical protein
MNIHFRVTLARSSFAFAFAAAFLLLFRASDAVADPLKQARVTQVIQDVRLLPSNAAPRPASVNDNVHGDTAVRTGIQSRSELTFPDQTLTRLGEQTIFTFKAETRTLNLGGGAILLSVPKKAGGTKIQTATVTAAISG